MESESEISRLTASTVCPSNTILAGGLNRHQSRKPVQLGMEGLADPWSSAGHTAEGPIAAPAEVKAYVLRGEAARGRCSPRRSGITTGESGCWHRPKRCRVFEASSGGEELSRLHPLALDARSSPAACGHRTRAGVATAACQRRSGDARRANAARSGPVSAAGVFAPCVCSEPHYNPHFLSQWPVWPHRQWTHSLGLARYCHSIGREIFSAMF